MTNEEIKKTLENQLQLLSERSESAYTDELPRITHAMAEIVVLLSIHP